MPHVFHVGQRVKCLRTTGYGHEGNEFTAGNFYEVRSWAAGSLSVVADDRGRPNGWNDRFFEPAEVDNRQSVTLYTIIVKTNHGEIKSHGFTTEEGANQYKSVITQRFYQDAGWEVLAMKKITVRI